jgi:hypothetical protein
MLTGNFEKENSRSGASPHFFRVNDNKTSEENFPAENFDSISTDTHIDNSVTLERRAYENAARTVHFDALLNEHTLLWPGDCVR